MHNNKVSVIMACYNEKIEWIRNSVESIVNQTYKNIELIIVNDNPKNKEVIDFLREYEKKDNRIKIIYNKENVGLVSSLNKAINLARGNYIARMDSDDISNINRIEKQVDFLENNKEIDLVMTHATIIDENDNVIKDYNITPCKMNDIKKMLKYKNISIHPTWLFRVKMLDILEGYNEIRYVEDYDFLCRAINEGFILGTVPEQLLYYRKRATSICHSNRLLQQNNFNIVNKAYRKAIKDSKPININYNKLNESINISQLKLIEGRINKAKSLIKQRKFLRGHIIKMHIILIDSCKRAQLINEIKYLINSKLINKL